MFTRDAQVTKEEMTTMVRTLKHRGPDDTGIFVDGPIGLGHNRLSIIDLSPAGHQPMSDERGEIWIVFNGEIYNYQSLRHELEAYGVHFRSKTDTEVIIQLYKRYGTECVQYLRGMFAFAIWDARKKELFLARDRIGKKPIKYYIDSRHIVFASELKALFQDKSVPREPDWRAIDSYLSYQYVPSPATGFLGIQKLPPAHYLVVRLQGERPPTVELKRYWTIDYTTKQSYTEAEWIERAATTITESVRLRLVSDVPLGIHLSGGVDSSLVAAIAADLVEGPLKTFSIGFTDEQYNELPFARLVAQRYSTDHQEYIVEADAMKILPELVYHYEEPYADPSALPTWYLMKMTKQSVTVALNGDGGDENFGGYDRYNSMRLFFQRNRIPVKSFFAYGSHIIDQVFNIKIAQRFEQFFRRYNTLALLFYAKMMEAISLQEKRELYTHDRWRGLQQAHSQSPFSMYWQRAHSFEDLDKIFFIEQNTYLPDDLLVKVDIAAMAHGVEARSPLLDQELFALTAQMPSSCKVSSRGLKWLLKKIAWERIPHECIQRAKQGFQVPLERWLRGRWLDDARDILLTPSFLAHGFRAEGIEALLERYQSHPRQHERQLWTLLCLAQWFRVWFDSPVRK